MGAGGVDVGGRVRVGWGSGVYVGVYVGVGAGDEWRTLCQRAAHSSKHSREAHCGGAARSPDTNASTSSIETHNARVNNTVIVSRNYMHTGTKGYRANHSQHVMRKAGMKLSRVIF